MLYLASASPRRQELLHQVGLSHEVLPSNLVEARLAGELPRDYVQRVAADKAHAVALLVARRGLPAYPVLSADTEVVIDNEVLGKPSDLTHAAVTLRRLSGRTHTVLTAISLVTATGEFGAISESRVTFSSLSDDVIARYLETGEADDKAGAYAIQGRAAGFIVRLDGSYSGVMGLPLYELFETLRRAGVEVR